MLKNKQSQLVWLLLIVAVVACTSTPETIEQIVTRPVVVQITAEPIEVTRVVIETEVVQATAVSEPAANNTPQSKDLTICTSVEPETLYFYGSSMIATNHVLHAIYTNDVTTLAFSYQAEGLEKLPSLADGDAVLNKVEVSAGDMVVDAAGDVVTLMEGMNVINAVGEIVEFSGEPISVEQMTVDFTMKQRYWSDGTPVTADDSVYSFDIAADPDTPTNKNVTDRTVSYEATGDLSTRWTGLPGFLDATFFTNFWQPLPYHAWQEFSAADLLEVVDSNRMPMGDGAFMIDEWISGESIRLLPNPYYYRADEGLPYLDSVTYKFISDSAQMLAQLLAGVCDIGIQGGLDPAKVPFLIEAEANGILSPQLQIGTSFDHIDFGINSYGDYGDGIGRPDWFEDVRVRQAMTMCTDRQRMVDDIVYGRSQVIHTYIPTIHPLYPDGLTEWPYDVAQANALLDEAGFLDSDGDGWREDPATGVPFQVTLGTMSDVDFRRQVLEMFKENMVDCGIDVELYYQPAGEWFADGPDGVLFGRQYDLGEFAWLTGVEPPCNIYISDNITGPIEEGFGGWGASSNTGWINEEFDAACKRAQAALPGTVDYLEGHEEAQRIFSQELPIIPLFLRLKVSAARPNVLNFALDPSQNSELYNIYEFDLQESSN